MKIRILTIGKLKEKYLVNGINEYVKRLNAYCKVEMVEVPDEPIPDNASENVENIIKDKEADKIVAKIKDDEYVEVTPSAIRLRKKILDPDERFRQNRKNS